MAIKPKVTVLWVLVANSSSAQIFEVKGYGKEIKEMVSLDNPDGRKKPGEILSDRPGRAFDRMGLGRHSLGTEVDIQTHERRMFAHKIAELLEKGRSDHSFQELVFIAPPEFLGELNNAMTDSVKKTVVKEINKDLPHYINSREKIEHIRKYLDF